MELSANTAGTNMTARPLGSLRAMLAAWNTQPQVNANSQIQAPSAKPIKAVAV